MGFPAYSFITVLKDVFRVAQENCPLVSVSCSCALTGLSFLSIQECALVNVVPDTLLQPQMY